MLLSLNIQLDYSFDSNNFFDTQAKKDELQAAANAIEGDLSNTLAAITPAGGNTWTPEFFNPANPQSVTTLNNIAVPANTIVIYVGGSALGGVGRGPRRARGIATASGSSAWLNTLQTRGESGAPAPFAPWGGSISFDTLSTNWYFGSDPAGLQSGQVDFFSMAEHEIGHVLGIGTSQQWGNRVQGGSSTGRPPRRPRAASRSDWPSTRRGICSCPNTATPASTRSTPACRSSWGSRRPRRPSPPRRPCPSSASP